MSVDLCEHDLPLRACEICRDAADLLGKGDNVLISRAYLTEWVREANKYQDAINKLEALEKENAALRGGLAEARKDAERYCHVRKNPAMLLHLSNVVFDEAIDAAMKEGK